MPSLLAHLYVIKKLAPFIHVFSRNKQKKKIKNLPILLIRYLRVLNEPTQLAATPAPPCPEFSTWTKFDPSNLVALILNPSFLMGLSVFQLSNPSPDVRDKVSPKRAWQTLSQSDTVVLVWSGPEWQSQRLYEVTYLGNSGSKNYLQRFWSTEHLPFSQWRY